MLNGHSKVVSDGQFTLRTQVIKPNYTVEFGSKRSSKSLPCPVKCTEQVQFRNYIELMFIVITFLSYPNLWNLY